MHPIWAVILLAGTMAVIAVLLPDASYRTWRTPKYLTPELSMTLLIGLAVLILGILIVSARALSGGSVTVKLTQRQLSFLKRTYVVLLLLVAVGYVSWAASAASQGVDINSLLGVVNRESGAISSLKSDSRPIAGVTTLTQFGPVVVVIGIMLRNMGSRWRWHYVIVALALFRGVFYAERLALLEVLIPAVVLVGALAYGSGRRVFFLRIAPLVVAPLALGFFAVFEYMRSWVYYQNVVTQSFGEWVSLRMLGYYVTSYNNSALLDGLLEQRPLSAPYFTIPFVYNAPIIGDFLPTPSVGSQQLSGWWQWALRSFANREFTNTGSFLMVDGELGTPGMMLYWFATGLVIGGIYLAMRRGSLAAVIAYACLFVGLLELPRFIYWTQGRSFPIVIAVIVIAIGYGVVSRAPRRRRVRHSLSPVGGHRLA